MSFISNINGTSNFWENGFSLQEREFICKIRKGSEIPKPPAPTDMKPDPTCAEFAASSEFGPDLGDFYRVGADCHFVSKDKLNHHTAREKCQRILGWDLVSIHSKKDQDQIHGALKDLESTTSRYYIGLKEYSGSVSRYYQNQLQTRDYKGVVVAY